MTPSLFISLLILSAERVAGWTPPSTRRLWLTQTLQGSFFVASSTASTAASSDELPSFLRDYTALAPLGRPTAFPDKNLGLSLEELAVRLTKDLTTGATGQGGYFLTGDLSTDIFRDDCVFSDPTNRVSSLNQYQNALRVLFDPSRSTVRLTTPLTVNAKERTISCRLRSRGHLQLPWRPYVTSYETTIVYAVDENGLISNQDQEWSKSASRALQETFTPSLVEDPPLSKWKPLATEPLEVTQLFDYINGRRPNEYEQEERFEIASLIDSIVEKSASSVGFNLSTPSFDRDLLPGTWILSYLQPGPNGEGIDRRIPFPEFDFNDSFQVFTDTSVVNIGQVLGPWVEVQVSGTIQEDDPTTTSVPKRFRANIEGGKLCVLQDNCIGLPIQGEGLFDSLYLGHRLRIGQNINGGGARVVQIRLDEKDRR
jgi:hypothetical protein